MALGTISSTRYRTVPDGVKKTDGSTQKAKQLLNETAGQGVKG